MRPRSFNPKMLLKVTVPGKLIGKVKAPLASRKNPLPPPLP